MKQRLKIFVSLVYTLIFLVFLGFGGLQTHAISADPEIIRDPVCVEDTRDCLPG
ncbi:MAG: hypothetical protein V7754_10650 [Halioglobus sp.]